MHKPSKSERKKDRIQSLDREIKEIKMKNMELQQQKTVRMDDEQLQRFFDELTQRIEWSTNRIVDETPQEIDALLQQQQNNDKFSYFIKWSIAFLFFAIAILSAYSLYNIWGQFWNAGWADRVALFIAALASFICAVLGIEILKEKDRNYILSIFSALVALVALIVTLVGDCETGLVFDVQKRQTPDFVGDKQEK